MITPDDLTTRFPGVFDDLGDALLAFIIDEAASEISEDVWGADYNLGLLYLSAHIAAYTTTPGGGAAGGGPVTKRRVGDVEVSFGSSAAALNAGELGATQYGMRFTQYRRWHQGGPVVPTL